MSDALRRLILYATALGYTVRFVDEIGPGVIGRIEYGERLILVQRGGHELVTLVHELGHAVAAARMGHGVQHQRTTEELVALKTGERRAYLYGWAVVRALGIGISRDDWRAHHAGRAA